MLQIHLNIWETVQLLQDFFSAMRVIQKKLETSNVFSSFIVCRNKNRFGLVCELLNNNSLFDSQLYEDKSLALRACDVILTTYLQTVNYYSIVHY